MTYLRAFLISALAALVGVVGLALASREPSTPPPQPLSKPLSQAVHVRDQLQLADIADLKAAGYRTVINLRPDGEARNQPTSQAVQSAAEAAGLRYAFVPTPNGAIPDAVVEELSRTLAAADGPVLLYCRSGSRASRVWALAEASRSGGPDRAAIATAVRAAGQKVDDLLPRIDARIAARR